LQSFHKMEDSTHTHTHTHNCLMEITATIYTALVKLTKLTDVFATITNAPQLRLRSHDTEEPSVY